MGIKRPSCKIGSPGALNNVCYSIQDNIIIACTTRIFELGDAPEHIGTVTHCIKLQLPTAQCTRSVHARLCKIAIDSDNCNTVCDQRIGDCIPRRCSRYRVVTLSSALFYLSITLFRELAEGIKTNVAARQYFFGPFLRVSWKRYPVGSRRVPLSAAISFDG